MFDLQLHGYGDAQWAFRKESSARDLLTILSSTWIKSICMGKKIGLNLNDIAGACDRVDKEYLLIKFYSIGISDKFLIYFRFLISIPGLAE